MTPIGWFVVITSIIVGSILGYFLFKRFPNLFNFLDKDNKKIEKVINDPQLLLEKLKAHGKIYEEGENGKRAEIDFKVGMDEKTGKEILMVEKIESKVNKVKEIKKEILKDKPKPKKKKKGGDSNARKRKS